MRELGGDQVTNAVSLTVNLMRLDSEGLPMMGKAT